jgi:hypothetical protein
VDSVPAYLEYQERLRLSLMSPVAEEARVELPLPHSPEWYCWPWEAIVWDGMLSANKWLRQVVCALDSKGDKPLAHPTLPGRNVTLSALNALKYGAEPQDSVGSLRRNEYFSVYKAMYPDMTRLYEESISGA